MVENELVLCYNSDIRILRGRIMNLENLYKQLTDVDINQQVELWNKRGKGYYGEYLLFCELYKKLKGNGKLLMNLNIPAVNSISTEIDLLLIHETGIFVFEIKHFTGVIYGKTEDVTWTQYLKTVPNHKFKNPIVQNKYHIDSLRKIYPDIPIYSVIVFTSEDCILKVENTDSLIEVCTLPDVCDILSNKTKILEIKYSMEEIDKLFNELLSYSPMKNEIKTNVTEAPFSAWLQPFIDGLEEKKKELEKEKTSLLVQTKKVKKTKIINLIVNIFISFLSILICVYFVFDFKAYYEVAIQKNSDELSEFKQNFLYIDEFDNPYIDDLNSYISVSDVLLNSITDDAVSFTATLSLNTDVYCFVINPESKYIVMTESGKVYEYDAFNETNKYDSYANTMCSSFRKTGQLREIQFYGITSVDEIVYIKITDIDLRKHGILDVLIKDDLEIGLYKKTY